MTLWSARNGYLGYGPVAALVEADTLEEATEKAKEALAAYAAPLDGTTDALERYRTITTIEPVTLPYVGDELP